MITVQIQCEPGATIDMYCECGKKGQPRAGLLEGTRTWHCKRHGQFATVTER